MYLITGPEGNSQFCFLKNLFPETKVGEHQSKGKAKSQGTSNQGPVYKVEGLPYQAG